MLTILSEMYTLMPKVGYLLLYFLSADRCSAPASERRTLKEKAAMYKDLCESIDAKYSLDICLVNDMRQCQEDDVNMFVHLVPEIFANFPRHSIGNVDLLYLIVSCIDGGQIQTLVCHILSRDIVMFKKDSFKDVVQNSLQWETFEQYAMWYLASAHELPVEPVIPLLPRIHNRYPEAQSNVLLMLKKESPSYEILKNILAREVVRGDPFVTSVLTCWMSEYDDMLADLITSLLIKQAASLPSSAAATSGKRKRGGQPGLSHPAELCLGHLDMLRQRLANHPKHADFLNQPIIRSGLQTVRSSCTETQKSKFSDLFALADSDSESEESSPPLKSSSSSSKSKRSSNSSTKSPGKSKKNSAASAVAKNSPAVSSDDSESASDKEVTITSRKKGSSGGGGGGSRGSSSKNPSRKRTKNVSYKISSEESSDDEEVVKRAPKKKKKVSSAANSDSD